jgi:RNA polymerase sigma-70 factor (ECF subfamily)
MDRTGDFFWKLLEPEHTRAARFCRRLAGQHGDDLYHDALVAAWNGFPGLNDRSRFRFWLYRIIVNTHKNRCQRGFWRRLVSLEQCPVDPIDPSDAGIAHGHRRLLERALRPLRPDERVLVTLYHLEGWPLSDLASLYGKKENALKVRLFRIHRKMRRALFPNAAERPTIAVYKREENICIAAKPSID